MIVTDLEPPRHDRNGSDRDASPLRFGADAAEPKQPAPAVVVVTGAGSVESAVDALKLGAADYLQKPLIRRA